MTASVDPREVEHFSSLAGQWWDERGAFAPLHRINPARIGYIKEQISRHWGLGIGDWGNASSSLMPNAQSPTPLTVLDIGCGGGLVSEPMARLGARVTGIDASEKNIEVARAHAAKMGLEIEYRCATAEELSAECTVLSAETKTSQLSTQHSTLFDIVLALEIIEHVADVPAFVASCCALAKPGGLVVFSTLNRTARSFALGIVAAEYVLKWVPKGTHQWEKFLKPSELCAHLRGNDVEVADMTGLTFSPLSGKWSLDPNDVGVNYFVTGIKA